ncbi:MAG: peptidoglycan DD-metalloendopeptidase family protein [Cyanobium sp.]
MKPFRSILPLLLVAPATLPLVSAVAGNPALLHDPSELLPGLGPVEPGDGARSFTASERPAAADSLAPGTSRVRAARPADQDQWLALDPESASRAPLSAPPEPTTPSAVVRFGDTLLKISQRYGLSIAELLRLNPELDTARLVVGSQIQVARSSPGRSRMLLGLAPVGSGGLSWPELPQFGERRDAPLRMAGGFAWPAEGMFSSGYGWRWGRMHKGIDIANNVGTPIVAVARGRVTFAGWHDGGYGYLVEITHDDGTLTRYAHNSTLIVRQGDQVDQGQLISRMGSTGRSTGPHLHFEVLPPGQGAMNPLLFLPPRA